MLLHIYKESSYIKLSYALQKELKLKQQLLEKKEFLELELYALHNHKELQEWAVSNGMGPITFSQMHELSRGQLS